MRVLLPRSRGARFHKDVLTHLKKASVGHGFLEISFCSMLTAMTPLMDLTVNVEAGIRCSLGSQLRRRHNSLKKLESACLMLTAK